MLTQADRIAQVSAKISAADLPSETQIIDAMSWTLLPGIGCRVWLDPQVHFREPGLGRSNDRLRSGDLRSRLAVYRGAGKACQFGS